MAKFSRFWLRQEAGTSRSARRPCARVLLGVRTRTRIVQARMNPVAFDRLGQTAP